VTSTWIKLPPVALPHHLRYVGVYQRSIPGCTKANFTAKAIYRADLSPRLSRGRTNRVHQHLQANGIFTPHHFWNNPLLEASRMGDAMTLLSGCFFIFSAHFSLNMGSVLESDRRSSMLDTYRYSTSHSSEACLGFSCQFYRSLVSSSTICFGLEARSSVYGRFACFTIRASLRNHDAPQREFNGVWRVA